jgi:hypothetical protein
MKMKMKYLMLGMMVITIFSCTKDENQDLERPILQSVLVNNVQQETHELQAGSNFVVQVNVSDNADLSQLKINVHSADDGHGHGVLPGYEGMVNQGVWSYNRVFELSGSSAEPSATIAIPDSISGVWHLEIMAIDKSGNEAIEQVYNIVVLNANTPDLDYEVIDAQISGDAYSIATGELFKFSASVFDEDLVSELHISISSEEGVLYWENEWTSINQASFSTGNLEVLMNNAGLFDVHIHATDSQGFQSERVFELEVTP